jgi:proton-translocating NADH-quinone oxidoreductase chain L
MRDYIWLIPLLPLLGFFINGAFSPWIPRNLRVPLAYLATVLVGASLALSIATFFDVLNGNTYDTFGYTLIQSGSFQVNIGFYVDQLTAIMLLVVNSVGFLVHLYSIGYMAHDEHEHPNDHGLSRFFSYISLFVFSMLMLVLADNFVQLYIFWEAVGLCSYLLIGFWYATNNLNREGKQFDISPRAAGVKAFVTNRIGDFGFSLGVMMIFWNFGTVAYSQVFANASTVHFSIGNMTWICFLLFLGAMGKSAQFPLHVWLPDAMQGPTPVSALIHAATMVTAGVYLVARTHPLFALSPNMLWVVAVIGTVTAILGATIALVQNDIKKVVAYSTISQLGYMFASLGVGAIVAAIFHLATHAMFKGLLFLGSGSVIHGMQPTGVENAQDIRTMGGLRRYMPITFITFLLAALANAGIVPLAGFWSKDEITGAFLSAGIDRYTAYFIFYALLTFTSLLTAFYMFRLIFIVFFGEPRWKQAPATAAATSGLSTQAIIEAHRSASPEGTHDTPGTKSAAGHGGAHDEHHDPHESGWQMALPLVVLAIPTLALGALIGFKPETGPIHQFLNVAMGEPKITAAMANAPISDTILTGWIIATIAAVLGIALAYAMYARRSNLAQTLGARFKPIYNLLLNKWYFDDLYQWAIINNVRRLGTALWWFDANIIDGAVNGIAGLVRVSSGGLRKVQTGFVQGYALAIALGLIVLISYLSIVAFSNIH